MSHATSDEERRERREQLSLVLSAALSKLEFDSASLQALCAETKPAFVTRTLKQLAADQLLGIVPSLNGKQTRYAWLVDRGTFDATAWLDKQTQEGSPITSAPPQERPRERLLELGAAMLKNSELLAILIRTGLRGESAVQAGQKLAAAFDDRWEQFAKCTPTELKQISKAVSSVAYCQIMAGVELGRRIVEASQASIPVPKINSTAAAISFCQAHFARLAHDADQEEFHIVTLDTKLKPIQSHRITVGTLDASLVHPREVFRPAIKDAASAVLLVHNHPSGDPRPSRQDFEVTDRMRDAGRLLGIQVVDHIVVARESAVSIEESS